MRKTIFSSVLILALVGLCSVLFSFSAADVVSKPSATGVIKVCWAPNCGSSLVATVVNLVDAHGKTLSSCTITPPNLCCKMLGDFPTGTYHFEYYSTGVVICKSAEFQYINGKDVELDVICKCP